MKRAVLAVFRPQDNDIAVFVEDGEQNAAVALTIDEARAIHGAIGLALRLADKVEDPVGAVPREAESSSASPPNPTGEESLSAAPSNPTGGRR